MIFILIILSIMKDLLVRILEWIIGRRVAIIYARLYDYKNTNIWCPFCYATDQQEYKYFNINKCNPEYPRTIDHLLVTTKRHLCKWSDMNNDEKLELEDIRCLYLSKWYMPLQREYPHCWASVEHLHLHLIKPK